MFTVTAVLLDIGFLLNEPVTLAKLFIGPASRSPVNSRFICAFRDDIK